MRIGTVDVLHVPGNPIAGYNVTVKFRVPATAAPGHYAYVLYCTWCAPKGEGSLIAWPDVSTLISDAPIRIGTALIIR
jgi:hypothetical protein